MQCDECIVIPAILWMHGDNYNCSMGFMRHNECIVMNVMYWMQCNKCNLMIAMYWMQCDEYNNVNSWCHIDHSSYQ